MSAINSHPITPPIYAGGIPLAPPLAKSVEEPDLMFPMSLPSELSPGFGAEIYGREAKENAYLQTPPKHFLSKSSGSVDRVSKAHMKERKQLSPNKNKLKRGVKIYNRNDNINSYAARKLFPSKSVQQESRPLLSPHPCVLSKENPIKAIKLELNAQPKKQSINKESREPFQPLSSEELFGNIFDMEV